jgi:hypothetical protein
MPHQTKPMSVRCRAPPQMDLFAGEPQKTISDTPAWSGLPTEIRAALRKRAAISSPFQCGRGYSVSAVCKHPTSGDRITRFGVTGQP